MSADTEIEVRRSISVPLAPAAAFELFTVRMTDYWPQEHSIGASELAEVVVEPHQGRRWFERGADGTECQWGQVGEWTPPGKVVLLWQIGTNWQYDPDLRTEIEVTFTEEPGGRTLVELRHRHLERYGDRAEAFRAMFDSPGGWAGTLTRYAELAE